MVDDIDILQEFVNESLEHLGTIEEELLAMEESGENFDEGVVNRIFRAAHSIKGGSSFFGLNNVKELAHRAETILDMVRSREMAPNPDVINILLAAFDKLREMLNNTEASERANIGDLLSKLDAVVSSSKSGGKKAPAPKPQESKEPPPPPKAQAEPPPPQAQKESAPPQAAPPPPVPKDTGLPQADIDRARRFGQYIYKIDCDLVSDIEKKGKTVKTFFDDLMSTGEILDCVVNTAGVGTLDDFVCDPVPLSVVFATIQEPDIARVLLDTIPPDNIHTLFDLREDAAPAPTAGLDVIHLAQRAGVHDFLDHPHVLVKARLEADAEHLAAGLLRFADGHGLLRGDAHGV
ncbi:MAG: Hpt domain-containing protein, partial [Syntrophorhabdaceae bacterium]|nr:Hpt domain-containing protein [Syntrophorhabdaceae bacterium]